jgi:hypothetical protein
MVFQLCFSGLYFGFEIFHELKAHRAASMVVLGMSVAVMLGLYMLDVSYWKPDLLWLKACLCFTVITGGAIGIILLGENLAAAPMMLFVLGCPTLWVILKITRYKEYNMIQYVAYISMSLGIAAIGLATHWAIWRFTYVDHVDRKAKYTEELCNKPGPTEQLHGSCMPAYMLYLFSLISAGVCTAFCLTAHLLAETLRHQVGIREESDVQSTVKVAIGLMMIGIFGVWVSSSISVAGVELGSMVSFLSVCLLIEVAVIVAHTVGLESIREQLSTIPIFKRAVESGSMRDWVRAIMFIAGTFPYIVFCFMSFLNQRARMYLPHLELLLTQEDKELHTTHKGCLTRKGAEFHNKVLAWNWSSVLTKSCYLSLAFLLLSVGIGKCTTLFFAWLNVAVESMHFEITVLIFIAIGVFMFLLPPVPGVPVYLAGGITLTRAAEREFGGFVPALAFSIVVCWGIKHLAVMLQQKVIGEGMSNSVSVKCLVGVNDVAIKSVRLILEQPGLTISKVCILCGGPDWPTSVLTGILRLSVVEMQIGTLPIVFLIAPCVMAGAFMVKADEGAIYETMSGIMIAVAALAQMIALMSAAFFIEVTSEREKAKIAEYPVDEEVAVKTQENAARSKLYQDVVEWSKVPAPMKAVLILGTVMLACSCYLVQLFGSLCFVTFEVRPARPCYSFPSAHSTRTTRLSSPPVCLHRLSALTARLPSPPVCPPSPHPPV